jgi:hypothetical protein
MFMDPRAMQGILRVSGALGKYLISPFGVLHWPCPLSLRDFGFFREFPLIYWEFPMNGFGKFFLYEIQM